MKLLSKKDQDILFDALHYCTIKELSGLCQKLGLLNSSKKAQKIKAIFAFVTTGCVIEEKSIPVASIAIKGVVYQLKPETHMVVGVYKNDAKTRAFMKTLIGEHFHFTAFGIDWLAERWMEGKPPTYLEFGAYWQQEYLDRKACAAKPKREWAYINFVQQYVQQNPQANKALIMQAWHKYRLSMVEVVHKILKDIS